jgi:excisionase family DNA binding protein
MPRPVAVGPSDASLTMAQAAEFLGVSSPYLLRLLERGEIVSHGVGYDRRFLAADLAQYKRATDEARLKVLDELAALDQEFGTGY